MQIVPYLSFEGHCDEAIAFYQKVLHAEVVSLMRFKENPDGSPTDNPEKVMHCTLKIGATQLMASDGECTGKPNFHGIALNIMVETDAEAKRLFEELQVGGLVCVPLQTTFFSSTFAMVNDRFGVSWMILVPTM